MKPLVVGNWSSLGQLRCPVNCRIRYNILSLMFLSDPEGTLSTNNEKRIKIKKEKIDDG